MGVNALGMVLDYDTDVGTVGMYAPALWKSSLNNTNIGHINRRLLATGCDNYVVRVWSSLNNADVQNGVGGIPTDTEK